MDPRRLAAVACVVALLGLPTAACQKARQERGQVAANQAALAAIGAYSAASDHANAAHKAVMDAFEKANHSANLAEYRASLQSQVLPALAAFIAQLQAMPTGTADLKRIHGLLVAAYQQADQQLRAFEASLDSPQGLGRFAEIRSQLQNGVKTYRDELSNYYKKFQRQLRVEAGPAPATSVAAPSAVTQATAATPAVAP